MSPELREVITRQLEWLREQVADNVQASQSAYDNAGRVREFYNSNRTFLAERGHIINGNPATRSWLALVAAAVRYSREAKAYAKLADDIENLYKGM